ncbi:glycosyltransferase [[Clostridium] fimetarium]|uniref:Glycosyl transferase family 2 n=1 Tax=[Clostridium] fimetarium TaxID=99656 RepID=A0A1I0Q852_9FIRM|nr:glycosyltransferase [[Clostridium] fimetarium]SEW23191.1 Glycosyl transferase family 2 [[Clostridium] fimetarium]
MNYEARYQQGLNSLSSDTASSIFILMECYNNNFNQEEILNLLDLKFWSSQAETFQNNYVNNINHFQISIEMPPYDQLPFLFIPLDENTCFYYDKINNLINGPLDFSLSPSSEDDFKVLYEPTLIYHEWNISLMKDVFDCNRYGSIYVIPGDTYSLLAFASILSLPVIRKYYNKTHAFILYSSFTDFLSSLSYNVNAPIPQSILCDSPDVDIDMIKQSILEIHNQRIACKHAYKPILSICIPTYNRGHLALEKVQQLTTSTYDTEIEFVISNNGSTIETEDYLNIERIASKDIRISYNHFDFNHEFIGNYWKVLLMSNANHALLMSDEDYTVLSSLPHYLGLLIKHPEIGVIRSGDTRWYTPNSLQNAYIKAGKNAVLHFFLRNNYMSGILYNCSVINEDLSLYFNQNYNNNEAFKHYPHEFLDMYLCNHYDFISDITPLFICGDSCLYSDSTTLSGQYEYQTKESRLLQLKGFIELINTLENLDDLTRFHLYVIACHKTFMLLKINLLKENDWNEVIIECKKCCIDYFSLITFDNQVISRSNIISLINEIAANYLL